MLGGPGAATEVAQANRVSGIFVSMTPGAFELLLGRVTAPLVVYCEGGLFSTVYQYLLGYRGLVFFTKSAEPLQLPTEVETVLAKKIWIPE